MEEADQNRTKSDQAWRGFSLEAVYGHLDKFSLHCFPPVQLLSNHTILYQFPIGVINDQTPPKPYKAASKWDDFHARLPNAIESQCTIYDEAGNDTGLSRPRWEVINEALSRLIVNTQDLQEAILMYNPLCKGHLNFKALNESLRFDENVEFYKDLLPRIIRLALQLPELIQSPIPFLEQNKNHSLSLTQQQISCLLANAFLCTFPERKALSGRTEEDEYKLLSEINFHRLFKLTGPIITEKCKCLFNYFRRVCPTMDCLNVPTGIVTFTRHSVDEPYIPDWPTCETELNAIKLHIDAAGIIENAIGLLQVIFADKYVGGDVLGFGCSQEEVSFIVRPEMIISKLFTQCLCRNEALFVIGCEQYNSYNGYSNNLKWTGDYVDKTPKDGSKRRFAQLVLIDALSYSQPKIQYEEEFILRELNKAYVGFSPQISTLPGIPKPGIATGNWGCGVHGGYPLLKAIIQIMACSTVERPLVYYTFFDTTLRNEIFKIYILLRKKNVRVCDLWHILMKFKAEKLESKELYKFIKKQLLQL